MRSRPVYVNGPYIALSPEDLAALPVGTVRSFDFAGLFLNCERLEDGTWRVRGRRRVPVHVVAQFQSSARWENGQQPEPEPEPEPERHPVDGPAAMSRVAKASGL